MKLPKLPKLSGLFRIKDADDESDEDFDEEVEENVDDAPDSDADDGDDDYDDDDSSPSRRPMVIAIAGALVLLAGVAGGAGWWDFSGDDGDAAKPGARKAASSEHKGPMVGLALPLRRTNSSRKAD